MLILTENNW